MTPQQTAQDARKSYIDKMGQELGELFHTISVELSWIHWRWQQYRILFVDKQQDINILNRSAGTFFVILHGVLFENTILAIARIVASPQSGRRHRQSNLTIERLLPLLKTNPTLRKEVGALIKKAKTSTAFAVELRNKWIAHRDLNVSLRRNLEALPQVTPAKVEECLSALREVMDCIEGSLCGAGTAYHFASHLGDAKALVSVLKDGLLLRAKEHEKLIESVKVAKRHSSETL